jgi:hypothetical protein
MLSIHLTEPTSVIEDKIRGAFAEEINAVIKKNLDTILTKSKEFAQAQILEQPEMQSLVSNTLGSLKAQFGIRTGEDLKAVLDIATAVRESVSVRFSKYNKKLRGGGLEIYFQPSSFTNLLGLQSGHVIYEGGDLHWLSWLLTLGDSTIVVGYYYDPETGVGRSGLGTMSEGGFFRVPPEFSGTRANNFVTRALIGNKQQEQILNILKSTIG